jgi:hypothetical protein
MLYLSTGALRQTTRNFTDTAYRFSNWCQLTLRGLKVSVTSILNASNLQLTDNFRQQQLPSPLWLLQLRVDSLRVPFGYRFPQGDK